MQIPISWIEPHFSNLTNLKELKTGGFKTVYSGVHDTDGDVVLKVINPGENVENIRREILAVQQVASPRVPKILDVGVVKTPIGDCFWFREERVMGESVRDLLANGPLSTENVLRLALHSLEALKNAESNHIVHRDVKPDNLMSSPSSFWLLDFGIARHLKQSSLTATVSMFGKFTPGYAPPEQFRNIKSDIDARADMFALGVTLHECVTGNNPFIMGASDPLTVMRNVENNNLPRTVLVTKNQSSSDSFADLIEAMTQKRVEHRPATVTECLTWLDEIIDSESK